MIRTARILLAGLLHVLAAKVDVRETIMFDMTYDDLNEYTTHVAPSPFQPMTSEDHLAAYWTNRN